MSYIILVSGGIKSGKSEFAEYLASNEKDVTYVALSESRTNDKNWQKKINIHKSRRPKNWKVIETNKLSSVFKEHNRVLLIDSIGGFVVNNLNENDISWNNNLNDLLKNLNTHNGKIIIVGEQASWGLVSEYKIANLFIERLGSVLKEITKISNENWLTINGKAIKLDNIFFEIPT